MMSLDWAYFEDRYPAPLSALKYMRMSGRLAHAFLICSENAEYRNEFPKLLSMLAACPTPNKDFSPCGKCSVCRQIVAGTYPDSFALMPVSAMRKIQIGEDADEPDTMRWFESMFYLASSTKDGWKLGVVHDAECLTEQAQNAFLKTLEEPPPRSLFILTTANPSELLPTTRSRCQIIRLTDNHVKTAFPGRERLPGILGKLAFESGGSLVAAESCAQELLSITGSLSEYAKNTVAEKWKSRLEVAQYLEKAGTELLEKRIKGEESCEYRRLRGEFLSSIYSFFGQIVLLWEGTPADELPDPELFQDVRFPEEPDLDRAYRRLSDAENLLRVMRTNANDELAIRSFCLKAAFE